MSIGDITVICRTGYLASMHRNPLSLVLGKTKSAAGGGAVVTESPELQASATAIEDEEF